MATLTREAVDWYSGTSHFGRPALVKKICELRLEGNTYQKIAETVGCNISYPTYCVHRVAREYSVFLKSEHTPIRVIKNKNKYNPNPVTYTTKMLICRYHEENLNKDMTEKESIKNIASELCREKSIIKEILAECKADGRYELYNRYGKSFLEVRCGV